MNHIPKENLTFWSGCCDITKLSAFYHFLCYKWITLAILRHKHETHSIVCIKCESKGIIEKFTVLVKEHKKIILKSVIECETCKYNSIKPFHHYFVCPFTNTVNFSEIPFDPYFIHTMKC